MSMTKIVELRTEIDLLERRLADLKAELKDEVQELKNVLPPDMEKRAEEHAEKYRTIPRVSSIAEYMKRKSQ